MWYYSQALERSGSKKGPEKECKSTLKIKQRIGTQEIYLRIDFERNQTVSGQDTELKRKAFEEQK